ncbi:MAG: glycosyltransferase [Candidatus Aminicenantes bacterium]|nr:MAG: glycosyltransferase [Candidatus Aminicenantes bacterium]
MKNFTVSIVIPAFNEAGNIELLVKKLKDILMDYYNYEILFVDDGSEDNTLEILQGLHQENKRIGYLSLSRNFGHQNALKAGLDHAIGDCVITMDADLQHPPYLIPQLITKWQEGYEMVYTIRLDDPRVSFLKRKTSNLFYKLMNWLSDIHIPKGAADFRLLDRSVVDVLKDTKEYHLFIRGITAWVGFRQYALEYAPDKRYSGKSKYTVKRMAGFALTGITSFSLKPLRLSILLGLFFAVLAFGYGVYAILTKLLTDQAVPGWASVLASVLFIGGIQLIVLGIIGEYIGKLVMESKQRPHYIIRKKSPTQRREYKSPGRRQTYNRTDPGKTQKKRKTQEPKTKK